MPSPNFLSSRCRPQGREELSIHVATSIKRTGAAGLALFGRHWLILFCLSWSACSSSEGNRSARRAGATSEAAEDSQPVDAGTADSGIDSAGTNDTAGAGPEPDVVVPPPAGTRCFDDPLDVVAAGEGFEVTGPHYRLYVEQDRHRSEETGRMLEAAWSAYEAYFGGAPEVAPGAGLRVKIYSTRARWVAGMAEDGLDAPGPPSEGYFDPNVGTAYLVVQPTVYYTDGLTLHEAAHQFHWRSAVHHRNLPDWYVEGVAEYIALHDWDGRCVRLGVRPLLNREDFPAQALNQIEANGIDLAAIISGDVPASRPVAWAIFAFFEAGMEGALAEKFAAFRAAIEGEGSDGPLTIFEREIGAAAEFEGPLLEWLRGAQLPMWPVHREWTHLRPDAVRGHGEDFTFALFRAPLATLTTEAHPGPGPWGLGVIIEYLDDAHFTGVVLFDSGAVSTFAMSDGSATWWDQGTVTLPEAGAVITVEVDRTDGNIATVRFGDTSFDFETTMPAILGLVINDSDVRFEAIHWRPLPG